METKYRIRETDEGLYIIQMETYLGWADLTADEPTSSFESAKVVLDILEITGPYLK